MPRDFIQTLRELHAGGTLDELTNSLGEVVRAVQVTGKPGELRLVIKIRPPRKGSMSHVTVEDDVVVKIPKRDRGDSIFFPTADGSLTKQDPNQIPLGLRPVPSPDVDPETGEVTTRSA